MDFADLIMFLFVCTLIIEAVTLSLYGLTKDYLFFGLALIALLPIACVMMSAFSE